MKILFIGDVVGSIGCSFLKKNIWSVRKSEEIDLVIANGENSADGNGITPQSADSLYEAGVDVISTGNHVYRRKEIYEYLNSKNNIIRPANFMPGNPGRGMCIYKTGKGDVAVINLCGLVYMESNDCPFRTADKLIEEASLKTKNIIIDFHAEATSEKRALAEYVCGRVSAVIGTHTHVPTADEKILAGKTGFITDVGMTGPTDSILGVEKDGVIKRFLTKMPVKFKEATGNISMNSVIITLNENGICKNICRFLL